jgi:hypothetical protein
VSHLWIARRDHPFGPAVERHHSAHTQTKFIRISSVSLPIRRPSFCPRAPQPGVAGERRGRACGDAPFEARGGGKQSQLLFLSQCFV